MPDLAIMGKYWPGTSPIHRLDPRAKLGFTLILIIIIFCAQSFIGLGLCFCMLLGFLLLSRIPLRQALRSIAPLSFIIVITIILNVFFIQGGAVLFEWAFIKISELGVYSAAFIGCRLFLLLLSMSILTLSTTVLDLTDAFDAVLKPLARIGVPAHELSMIMGISLRFLPQFIEEFNTIRQAQMSRGAVVTLNPFKGGLRVLGSLGVPLFTSAFRHADTLSAAMDARCYHGGPGRSKLAPLTFSMLDLGAFIVLLIILALVIASNFI